LYSLLFLVSHIYFHFHTTSYFSVGCSWIILSFNTTHTPSNRAICYLLFHHSIWCSVYLWQHPLVVLACTAKCYSVLHTNLKARTHSFTQAISFRWRCLGGSILNSWFDSVLLLPCFAT
jgi:hypothetical protein